MEIQEDEIARLRKRLREDPRSLAFVPLAELLRKAGRGGEALSVIRVGLRQRPEHAAARVVLARLHLDAGARALAVSVLEEVVEHDLENLAAGALLAELWVDEGRLREARALIDRLARANPGDTTLAGLMRRANPPPRPLH
ncbi:MAG: tetratricopeptide repeat protein, partial [Deltaproteobacteria bacterium]|nr:tetratricopeptide repeat protein [Deltaproteobacteria bacterium]